MARAFDSLWPLTFQNPGFGQNSTLGWRWIIFHFSQNGTSSWDPFGALGPIWGGASALEAEGGHYDYGGRRPTKGGSGAEPPEIWAHGPYFGPSGVCPPVECIIFKCTLPFQFGPRHNNVPERPKAQERAQMDQGLTRAQQWAKPLGQTARDS